MFAKRPAIRGRRGSERFVFRRLLSASFARCESMPFIGKVRIAHPLILAPMEEHTNFPFRLLMKQHGASLVCSERVDAVDVAARDRRALRLLHTRPIESP